MTPDLSLAIQVPDEGLGEALSLLSDLDTTSLDIQEADVGAPDPSREHPSYSVAFVEVTQIALSVLATSGSILGIATALLQLRDRFVSARIDRKFAVTVEGRKIEISGVTTEELAAILTQLSPSKT